MRERIRRIVVVFRKEFLDHFRDRRSLGMALIYPILGPLLLGGSLYFAGNNLLAMNEAEAVTVPARGAEHAPALVAFLADNNIYLKPAPDDPETAVREGIEPLAMIFPESAAGQDQFGVKMLIDLSRIGNVRITSRVMGAINAYNNQVAKKISLAAGLAEDFASAVKVEPISVARQANIAIFFYNLMPPLVIFMVFLSGVYLSIDMTAGERDRGQLEPLLIAPVERWELLLAKSAVAFLFTMMIVAINLLAFRSLFGAVVEASDRLVAPPEPAVFVAMFFVALPMMAIAVALQMSIAVVTRSMKEAQIYLGLLPLVPALPGMIMVFAPLTPQTWIASIPILGQMMIFDQLVAKGTAPLHHVALATGSTALLAGLVFWQAARLFQREKLFFLG